MSCRSEFHEATGEWTLQRLAGELAHRGLTNRAWRDRTPKAVTWQGLAKILANPVYVGIVEWNGVQHPGTHEPLVDPETFRRVQELLAARAARGTRERKHPHYLKGLLHCGVSGRRLSIQHSKGRYTYFFCLGQKNDPTGTCRERYVAAEDLEAQVEELYQRIQLPASWAERLHEEMAAEIVERQRADAAQRELLTRRLAKAEAQRRKLLDAYYSGAIDVPTLKTEQARIGADIEVARDRLAELDANLGEWQEILELAATLATRCGDAYRKANDRTRKQFNAAVFERLDVKDGRLCHEQYRPHFDDIFSVREFEYETRVETRRLELPTSCVQSRRSSQLSYVPAGSTVRWHFIVGLLTGVPARLARGADRVGRTHRRDLAAPAPGPRDPNSQLLVTCRSRSSVRFASALPLSVPATASITSMISLPISSRRSASAVASAPTTALWRRSTASASA